MTASVATKIPANGKAKCLLIAGTQFQVWNHSDFFFDEKSGQELFELTHTMETCGSKHWQEH
jgi:hypothetical protein